MSNLLTSAFLDLLALNCAISSNLSVISPFCTTPVSHTPKCFWQTPKAISFHHWTFNKTIWLTAVHVTTKTQLPPGHNLPLLATKIRFYKIIPVLCVRQKRSIGNSSAKWLSCKKLSSKIYWQIFCCHYRIFQYYLFLYQNIH